MRVSVWQQDRPGKRWRRIGVVEIDFFGSPPFKTAMPIGDQKLVRHWPRWHFAPMEKIVSWLPGVL
jgi:hypothetical protein